jgi:arabinose-5-phosphate isomerase
MKPNNTENILADARSVISLEAKAIEGLVAQLNSDFADAVELIAASNGRIIVTGIGKSANIAQKIVATFNSTGTPAVFMHAADAIHGDLGIVQKNDIVLCLSKSGNTPEIKVLIPLIKTWGNTIIAIVSEKESYLAQNSDKVLIAHVQEEACPNNLAPTSSSTAQLVLGDALAICLLKHNRFTPNDFAKYHPGGMLGKKLYLTVKDICITNQIPSVFLNDSIDKVILEISGKLLGATVVINPDKSIAGIITDGDLRRMLQKHGARIAKLSAKDIMSEKPKIIDSNTLAAHALKIMEQNNITQLIITEDENYFGMIHLHDLLKEGFI